jgi:hypothetical protein
VLIGHESHHVVIEFHPTFVNQSPSSSTLAIELVNAVSLCVRVHVRQFDDIKMKHKLIES